MTQFEKGSRVTGLAREAATETAIQNYRDGKSIRQVAETFGRSYGFVHRLLLESGTVLRGRGGVRGKGEARRSQ